MADESAYHFFGLLLGEDVAFHGERIAALAFYRGPVWILDRGLGFGSFDLLRIVYGVSLYAAWPVSLALCYGLCRRHERMLVLFPVLSLALGSMNAGLFSASESHFMHALFWPLAFALLIPGGGLLRRSGVLIGAVAFVFSYGGTAVLGVWLLVTVGMRLRTQTGERGYPLLVALLASAAVGCGIYANAVASPGVGSLLQGLVLAFTGSPRHANAIASGVALLLIAALALRPTRWRSRVTAALLIGLAAFMALYHRLEPGSIQPDVAGYFVRSLNVVVPSLLFGLLIPFLAGGRVRVAFRALRLPILLLWLGQIGFLVGATEHFQRYLEFMGEYTAGQTGVFRVDTPGFMEKVEYGPEDGDVLRRKQVGGAPVHAFTSMWIAVPAHTLLYSPDGEIRTVVHPRRWLLPEYRRLFDEDVRRKLAARGLRVTVAPRVIAAPDG